MQTVYKFWFVLKFGNEEGNIASPLLSSGLSLERLLELEIILGNTSTGEMFLVISIRYTE